MRWFSWGIALLVLGVNVSFATAPGTPRADTTLSPISVAGGRMTADSLSSPPALPPADSMAFAPPGGTDSASLALDTVAVADSTVRTVLPSSSIDAPIHTKAQDSIVYHFADQTVELYGAAELRYRSVEFDAGHMALCMDTHVLHAIGQTDSAGTVTGEPKYKDGDEEYTMREITYNLDSKKARITGVVTHVSEGYLHGEVIKRLADETIHVANGKFTTCDLREPHFYIALTKAKVIPNDKIFTDVAYLVIADVPTPLILPFGFFPNSTSRASGIILPEYGEERTRGFFLRDGGVYIGLNDYMDLTLLGSFYTKGSWDVSIQSRYTLRYRFSGALNFTYSVLRTGQKGTPTRSDSYTYRLNWSHSQDRKTHPNSTFQANVSFGSSAFNRYNSRSTEEFMNNQIMSSISYSRVFPGTPLSLSASLNHTQNTRDSMIDLRFPQLSLNMARVYPFKRKVMVGQPRWYEKIGINYGMNLQNSVRVKEDKLFTREMYRDLRNGMSHQASLSTSFTLFKFVNVSPSASYRENWYLKTTRYHWDATRGGAVRDTVDGFARAWNFNTSLSASTKLYGMFQFRKNSRIQAIRHVMTPTVGLSYHPDFSDPRLGMYREVQIAPDGRTRRYSIFENTLYGGPSAGESGSISMSLGNNIEMKVRDTKDTVTGTRKIPILQSLNLSASYNLLADSLNWSDVYLTANTNLLNFLNLSGSASFSPYSCDARGSKINRFYFREARRPLRFQRASLGCSFSLRETLTGEKAHPGPVVPLGYLPGNLPYEQALGLDYLQVQYADFSAPWDVSVNYHFTYTKMGLNVRTVQSVSLRSNFSIGKNWSFAFSTSYDMNALKFGTTTFNIARDLHCWQMSLNIVPFGILRSFSFRINIKSSLLRDLKYEKNRSYIDNLLP